MMSWKNLGTLVLASVMLVTLSASRASALAFNLTDSNCSTCVGPFATVNVSLVGQTATITFTSLQTGNLLFLLGDGGTAGVNVNSTSFTHSATATESNILPGFGASFKQFDSGNEDGFGSFNLVVDNNDGFTDSATSVSFTVTNTNLSALWLTDADVLVNNSNGEMAAAHIFPCTNTIGTPCTTTSGVTGNTFFAAGSPGTTTTNLSRTGTGGDTSFVPTPEPASLLLLGTGLAVVARRVRRNKKQR